MSFFETAVESHAHSLQTLNQLFEYDDFMMSIGTLADLGCGEGHDLEWWATRTTRDETPIPLDITCVGVDILNKLDIAHKYPNITYQRANFEDPLSTVGKKKFDVLWCHDSFQYVLNPLETLKNWWNITTDGGMLAIAVPQTTNIYRHRLAFRQEHYVYHHYTLVNLIHMLAVSGWDCRSGFFQKKPQDPWLHAIVYKSEIGPMDPRTTDWHKLSELGLLPESADKSVYAHGELHHEELVLPWVDQSLSWMGQQ